jgi:N6-adenosine-specific RNA methylase IME4
LIHSYQCILADPPYHFDTYSSKGQGRSPSQHYSTMTVPEIAALPVGDLAASDAWLFLWVSFPHLPYGLQLIEAWGFKYSGSAFCWVKPNQTKPGWFMGLGHTTRKNAEVCLLGRRGSPHRNAKNVRELIVAPRRQHSRKPDEAYDRIERFCSGPYVELWARQNRPGWAAWGDEVGLFNDGAKA